MKPIAYFQKILHGKKGALPVAPILGTIKTKRGLILMKAVVKGENLGESAKRFAAKWKCITC
ncbi:MAG: hypothetical protein V9H26_06900 [Verrucomicrobiota bacterium]